MGRRQSLLHSRYPPSIPSRSRVSDARGKKYTCMTLKMTKELEPSRTFFFYYYLFISCFRIGSIARLDTSCEHVPNCPRGLDSDK
ncbi:hypothetical protein BJY01DRAFT_229804 [Aspergillus pseudoustus]|uniref:Uncharacterized protein n=1 Tax=Aspergillus pseudoustus TaxID=1810923 RepID=A0ABR4IGI3_9EURO